MSEIARVLFVVPPIRLHEEEFEYLAHLPRHAVVLAAELQDDYEVQILDVTAEFHADPKCANDASRDVAVGGDEDLPLASTLHELVIRRITEFRPDIVVVHAHAAPHLPIVKLTFDAIIEVLPGLPDTNVVVGGMAATHLTQPVADWAPDGSWIIRGEGTGRILDLFALVLGKRRPNLATELISTMKGQRATLRKFRKHGATSVEHFERPHETTVQVLDIVGNPAVMNYRLPRFDLLPMETYVRLFRSGEFVPHLEMSSGCTYGCKFCGVHYLGAEGRFRRRPTANVIDEMKHLRDTYNFDEYYFCDETFTLDRKHARELCERIIDDLPGIRWRCVTRVDKMDRELAQLMFDSGCFEIGFGVEVGNNEVLQENTKEATVDLNIETIRLVQDIGIDANALTIIGLPQEDHCDIRRTFEFLAKDARPNRCQIFVFHPVPGTEYFRLPEVHGLRFDTRDVNEWYKWDHIGEPVCDTEFLSREDIARYFMLFNRAFSTMMWPERDDQLIDRILTNRFPIRRKGVTWQCEGEVLRIYQAAHPSRNIMNNTLELEFTHAVGENAPNPIRILEYVLSRCDGLWTAAEITCEVKRLFGLNMDAARQGTQDAIDVLSHANLITEF